MALGQYRIKVVPVLDTASLKNQLDKAGAKGSVKAGAATGGAYASGFGRAIKERFKYSIANALIYGTEAAFKDMIQNVKELDAAQTELKKVTDLSGKTMDAFTEQAYKVGKATAKTGTEIVEASTQFAKMGKDPQTALRLSELATRFQNIADTEIDAATAATFINSQLKAFGNTSSLQKFTGDFEKAQHVIDATNEVANNFAVGTNDLQNALTKAGSAMSVAGNSFEQTIGMVTAGTEIMVGQPAKVGRGLRTIAINIAKLAKEESTLEIANGKYTVSLQDQEGQMRSTYDIMSQIGEVWGELNETEQTALATQLAGKTQFEVFSNVMKNWGSAVEATKKAEDAHGSSLRENERYLDSIEGKIQNFQSAWEQLSYHLINSDMIKGVVDFGTTVVTTIDNLIQEFGAFPVAIAAVGTALSGLKLNRIVNEFLGIGKILGATGKVAGEVAEEVAEGAAKSAMSAKGGVGSLVGLFSKLSAVAAPLAITLATVGAGLYLANRDYSASFNGKIDKYRELKDEIGEVSGELDLLIQKEGELTNAEAAQKSILETKLKLLEKQAELAKKEAESKYNEDAKNKRDTSDDGDKKKGNKSSWTSWDTEEDLSNAGRLNKIHAERLKIDEDIVRVGQGRAETAEQIEAKAKKITELEKEQQRLLGLEKSLVENVSEDFERISELDYSNLDEFGKAEYDKTFSAMQKALTDIPEVGNAIDNVISKFGSAQFQEWNLDVSSFKTAEEMAESLSNKIKELDGEEEITLYARDEAGNVIDEVVQKKGDLTNEEWELVVNATTTGNYDKLQEEIDSGKSEHKDILMKFVPEGLDKVKKDKEEASKDEEATINVTDNGTAGNVDSKIDSASKGRTSNINVTDSGTAGNTQGKISGIKGKDVKVNVNEGGDKASGVQSNINSVKGKDVSINIFKYTYEKIFKSATGKRKGEKGGMSWLGDEGTAQNPKPELVVGEDGAYLAGTEGWEMRQLKSTDTVYTHAQTKKLLGNKQTFVGTASPLPMYKKGKKAKKKTTKKASKPQSAKDKYDSAKKAYDKAKKGKNKKKIKKAKKALDKAKKALDNKRSAFDSDLETLKYQAEVNDWTEAKFQEEYAKLVGNYGNNLSTEQVRAFKEEQDKYNDALARKDAERLVGLVGVGAQTAASVVNAINNKAHLTADEKKDYKAQAYKASVEYNLKEYQNGKKTRDQILADIKNYYNTRGQYDDEYYKMLDDLREADKKRELDRLNELQDKEESKLNYLKKYAQRQKDYYDDQIKKEKEEADELERLTDLQDKLNNAKKTMIKVYREGVGFVYEQDVEAIRDAQKALDEYNKAQEESELEKQAEEWQKILDLIGDLEDLSDMKELELKLGIGGITDLTGGDIGTDLNKWSEIVKNILATSQGYAEIIKLLDKASGADIEKLIGTTLSDGEKTVSLDMILEYIKRHSFASGSLNTPSGLSLIGENGPEIGWLNKGSTIFSNSISKNLMNWGQYTPAQILEKSLGTTQSQVFNFDKIVLPNVRDADDFYKELQLLPNKAIQQSALRM